jgi:hypothetical protein
MNPLRPPSSTSRRGRAGPEKKGASAATTGSAPAPPVQAATTSSPPLPSLQSVGFPAWWNTSSPMDSNARYVYLELGRVLCAKFSLCCVDLFKIESII